MTFFLWCAFLIFIPLSPLFFKVADYLIRKLNEFMTPKTPKNIR